MPGLRSLVARRRSSLASPPYVPNTSNQPPDLSDLCDNTGKGQKSDIKDLQPSEQVNENSEEVDQDQETSDIVNSQSLGNDDFVTPEEVNENDNEVNQSQELCDAYHVISNRTKERTVKGGEVSSNQELTNIEPDESNNAQGLAVLNGETALQNEEPTVEDHVESDSAQNTVDVNDKEVNPSQEVTDVAVGYVEKDSSYEIKNVDSEKNNYHQELTNAECVQNNSLQELTDGKNEAPKENEGTTEADHAEKNSAQGITIVNEEVNQASDSCHVVKGSALEGKDVNNKAEIEVIRFVKKDGDNVSQSDSPDILTGKQSNPSDGNGKLLTKSFSNTDNKDQAKLNSKICDSGNQSSDAVQCSERINFHTVSKKYSGNTNNRVNRSAMEIESTLASRGVTIVRRMVDSTDNSGRVKNEMVQNTKNDVTNNGSVITANIEISKPGGISRLSTQSYSRSSSLNANSKGLASVSIQSGSSVRHFSGGQISRTVSKDMCKANNVRGTFVKAGPKAIPIISNRKGSTQLNPRGMPINPNSKVTPLHPAWREMPNHSNMRGPTVANIRGLKVDITQKGLVAHKGFAAHLRPRGPVVQNSLRGTALQPNLRGPAMPTDHRGLPRYMNTKGPLRYTSPRGPTTKSTITGVSPQSKSAVLSSYVRPVTPQLSRSAGNQSQPRSIGLPHHSKSAEVSLLSRPAEVSPQARPTEMSPRSHSTQMSPQSRPAVMSPLSHAAKLSPYSQSTKMSPQSNSAEVSPQSRPSDLLSKSRSAEVDLSAQSRSSDMSPQSRTTETVLSPQSRSAEVSPQSRSAQISPQALSTGIHPHSRYTGMSPQSRITELSSQSRSMGLLPQSGSAEVSPQLRSTGLSPQSASTSATAAGRHAQMSMMGVPPQTSTIGTISHSNNERLPPHSTSGGHLSQANTMGIPSQILPSGLPHMVNSERFSGSASSSGFPGFSGRSEAFSPYNNPGEFSTPSNTNEFSAQLNSGGFNMHSNSGGFPTQTNLVGYPTQTNSCGFPQPANSGDYSSHNPGGLVGQTDSEGFRAHSSCGGFPTPINPAGGYTPHSSAEPFNVPTNSGEFHENPSEMMMYPGSRDFSMHTNSREFPSYSNSDQLSNHPLSQEMSAHAGHIIGEQYTQSNYGDSLVHTGYREASLHSRTNPGEVPLLPDFRESSLQHNYRDSSVPHNYGNFRDPSSQNNSRTSQSHSSYRDMPLHPNMSELQGHANTRAQTPHVNFKEQPASTGYRGQDILGNYMDPPAIPNFRETMALSDCREQSIPNFRENVSHTSPREQVLPNFREDVSHTSPREHVLPGFGENISHTSPSFGESVNHASPTEQVLPSLREPINHNSPRDQIIPFGEPVNHTSPRNQVISGFREPVSHASPREQVLPSFQETVSHTSPREQVLPSFGDSVSHNSPREILPSFQETLSDTSPKQPFLPGFREPIDYTGFREPMDPNNSNPRELLDYAASCRQPSNSVQSNKIGADDSYRDAQSMSDFRVNSQHITLEEPRVDMKFKEASLGSSYTESTALPSFTESFEHSSPSELLRKKENNNAGLPVFRDASHYTTPRSIPDCGSFKETAVSPSSRSPGYANARNCYGSHHTGDLPSYLDRQESSMYPCANDSSDSLLRESTAYCSKRELSVHSSSVYSSAHTDVRVAGVHVRSRISGVHVGARDSSHPEKSHVQSTQGYGVHSGIGNSLDYSGTIDSLVHPDGRDTYIDPKMTETSVHHVTIQSHYRNLPLGSSTVDPANPLNSVEGKLFNNESSLMDVTPNEFDVSAFHSSPTTSHHINEHPVPSKCVKAPVDISPSGSPSCSDSVGSPEKFSSVVSSSKHESGASPSSQDRIVIKMKLLHSDLGSESERHCRAENASVTELGCDSRNSVKYPLSKYTRWTIDSIINGREDINCEEGLDKLDIEEGELGFQEDCKSTLSDSPKRTSKRRSPILCSESKDTKLDTNKNLMKKTLRITIANPLRTRVSPEDDCTDAKVKESKCDSMRLGSETIQDEGNGDVQSVTISSVHRSSIENDTENQTHLCTAKKLRVRHLKSTSPAPSIESCASSASASRASSRRCSRSSDASVSSVTSVFNEGNDYPVVPDIKKCSIVIKRIYTTDNYSCYSSSLCDKKSVLNKQDARPARPKRKAAVEASERCHKSLRSLDTTDIKKKNPHNGAFNKGNKFVSVNLTTSKNLHSNIPRCSVLLYDIFMNCRINKMMCPGCSRHYDSSDSVQVNINKATISLLCSACQWLVVKTVHPREVDSMAPS
ncbi:uncharacterized protein LOC121870364 [Homarus americanus]|nr:uncharacterized protein LOC121870364 [Homarus americanus]XP_042228092.1 uncharacterized protein LOC121870364 [Homarus americanus]